MARFFSAGAEQYVLILIISVHSVEEICLSSFSEEGLLIRILLQLAALRQLCVSGNIYTYIFLVLISTQ